MGRNSLNHRRNPKEELPLFANSFLRIVPGKVIDDILERGGDAGFTCPKCGEHTETLICECETLISHDGQEIEIPLEKNYDEDVQISPNKKQPKGLIGIGYEYNRKKFTLFFCKEYWYG